ncbi:MAG: cytochrome c [Nitrospira sp.]
MFRSSRHRVGSLSAVASAGIFWPALLFAALLPLSLVFAHGEHGVQVEREQDEDRRARTLLHSRCAMCHSTDLIFQQSLDTGRWKAEVDRMVKWGAPIDKEDQTLLVAYLSRHYGTENSGIRAEPNQMKDQHADPAVFTQGRAENGKALYGAHCADCHGAQGEGHDAPSLAANPILTMNLVFVELVRQGRGNMPPWDSALSPQEIADIQAWLKTLR